MRFSCQSQELQKGISIVEKAVSQRSSLPVLENIYFEITDNQLKLRGNNLEIGIENTILINGDSQEGSILIKAKTISSIMSKLQEQALDVHVDESNKVIIKGHNVDFDIHGLKTEEYPVFPEVDRSDEFDVDVKTLQDLIKHTIFSVSFDETKQFLNGILMEKKGTSFCFVSTDGYRLAKKDGQVSALQDFSIIVPYKAINELNKIIHSLSPDDKVTVSVSKTQVSFKTDQFLLVSRLIQGQFPDYTQVIPSETSLSFSVPRRLFLEASERASIIGSASNNVVRFQFEDQKLTMTANAKELGEFKEELPVSRLSGQDALSISFNIRLILDVVRVLADDDIRLSFNNELSPCKVEPIDQSDFTYIIMPIRTSTYSSGAATQEEA